MEGKNSHGRSNNNTSGANHDAIVGEQSLVALPTSQLPSDCSRSLSPPTSSIFSSSGSSSSKDDEAKTRNAADSPRRQAAHQNEVPPGRRIRRSRSWNAELRSPSSSVYLDPQHGSNSVMGATPPPVAAAAAGVPTSHLQLGLYGQSSAPDNVNLQSSQLISIMPTPLLPQVLPSTWQPSVETNLKGAEDWAAYGQHQHRPFVPAPTATIAETTETSNTDAMIQKSIGDWGRNMPYVDAFSRTVHSSGVGHQQNSLQGTGHHHQRGGDGVLSHHHHLLDGSTSVPIPPNYRILGPTGNHDPSPGSRYRTRRSTGRLQVLVLDGDKKPAARDKSVLSAVHHDQRASASTLSSKSSESTRSDAATSAAAVAKAIIDTTATTSHSPTKGKEADDFDKAPFGNEKGNAAMGLSSLPFARGKRRGTGYGTAADIQGGDAVGKSQREDETAMERQQAVAEDEMPPRQLNSSQWNERYHELQEYRNVHGNCNVPFSYAENPLLASWVKRQRYQYKCKLRGDHSHLTDERQSLLNEIGFVWDTHVAAWEEKYAELEEFYKQNGHSQVPIRNKELNAWCKRQRRHYKEYVQTGVDIATMTAARVGLLNKIEFQWQAGGTTWESSAPGHATALAGNNLAKERASKTRHSTRKRPPPS